MKRLLKISEIIDPKSDDEIKKEIEYLGKTRDGIGKMQLDPYPDYRTTIKPK